MDTKKYIIEIPDNTAWIQWVKVSDKDGHVCFDFKDPEDLTPYTEPDLEQALKKAYYDGYETAKHDYEGCLKQAYTDAIRMEGYQKGLSDAWDAARKIVLSREDGGLFGYEERKAVFGCGNYMALKTFLAPEAIKKIRQYEQEQEEIKVGDEIEWNGENYVATYIHCDNEYVDALDCSDGSVCDNLSIKAVKKTGRHFPEIAEVLRKMQEEKE